MEIVTVFGPAGSGSCRSIYVEAENGAEYLAKGPSLTPELPHIGANELVAAKLAARLGLPVLDVRVLYRGDNLFVGRAWIGEDKFHAAMDEKLFNDCSNAGRVYLLTVFDVWVCNVDRHEANLMARCRGQETRARKWCGWSEHSMIPIDHGHCLLCGDVSTTYFQTLAGRPSIREYLPISFLRRAVTDPQRLSEAVAVAESVADADIEAIVSAVPNLLLPEDARADWISFLVNRRGQLRNVLRTQRPEFPNLVGVLP